MSDALPRCYHVSAEDCEPEDHELLFARSSIEAKRRWASRHDWPDDTIAGISAIRRPEWDHHRETGVPALARIDDGWTYECTGCGTTIGADYIGTRERSGDDIESFHFDREYGPDLTVPLMDPVEPIIGRPWCHQSCYEDDVARAAILRRYEERIWSCLVRRLLRRMPDAEPLPLPPTCHETYRWHAVYGDGNRHSYCFVQTGKRAYVRVNDLRPWQSWRSHTVGGYGVCEAHVRFRWPDAKYGPASFRVVDGRYQNKPRKAEFFVAGGDREAFEAWAEAQRDKIVQSVLNQETCSD